MSDAPSRVASNIDITKRSTSTSNRFSTASTETGESSKPNSIAFKNGFTDSLDVPSVPSAVGLAVETQNGQRSNRNHRSHKSRGSGGFLLSDSTFERPSRAKHASISPAAKPLYRHESSKDSKGTTVNTPEKKQTKKPNLGLGISGSPLATNVTNAGHRDTESMGGDSAQDPRDVSDAGLAPAAISSSNLDVDSAQIVNLALNLSESRRIVARRNVSTPLPPTVTSFSDGAAGGSLRQYLQQQRRSSRNISPKPDRNDRAFTASPRLSQGQKMDSPLQAAFGVNEDTGYQYHFSASTLARAEKAKRSIELMAQYRELLQYVPPLKPQLPSRAVTKSPPNTAPGSPTNPGFPLSRTSSGTVVSRPLGRPYNPLQYIRNRKVRARERKAVDGEGQGFGDVEKVTAWVGNVLKQSASDGYRNSDTVLLPPFTAAADSTKSPPTSPQNTVGRSTNKIKRPRVDWITNPADMLADIYWLEQSDNKKLIEDNRERRLFPQNVDLIRPVSRQSVEPDPNPTTRKEEPTDSFRTDTDLPKFSSVRNRSDHLYDSARGRALHKLQKAAHLPEDLNRLGHEHHLLKSHLRSSSESSNSDSASHRSKHRRSGTADTQELFSSDILEKQMTQMIEKEARESEKGSSQDVEVQNDVQSIEQTKHEIQEDPEKSDARPRGRNRAASYLTSRISHRRKNSLKPSGESQSSSKRASLDAPSPQGRPSSDGLDTTAPNSPETYAAKITANFIPSSGLELSPPQSRSSSPTRKPALQRMKSKINLFHDRGRNHSRASSVRDASTAVEDIKPTGRISLDVPVTPIHRRRSESPVKRILTNKTDESSKSASSKAGSLRRRAEDVPSGIKGLFKGGRNPVTRVGDLIWRKEPSPASVVSSNTSTDYSDLEDEPESGLSRNVTSDRASSSKSRNTYGEGVVVRETRPYILPTFTSPFEGHDRGKVNLNDTDPPESDYLSKRQRAREDRKSSRFHLLKPPRIDIQNASPSSSPDFTPAPRRSSQISDISEYFDRRRSSYGVQGADARLNSILGLPGAGFTRLPVTGLARLEDNRRPSMTGTRQWSVSERAVSAPRGPMTKREIARLRALLLSSGIKANQIARYAAEEKQLGRGDKSSRKEGIYAGVAALNRDPKLLVPVPRSQEHVLAARILSNDIQLSSRLWEESAETFATQSVGGLLDRIDALQDRIMGRGGLSEMTRAIADDADSVSKELVTEQTLKVKELVQTMQRILRRRRRRFRWVRRGGWVMLEWILVGVMWWAWLVVVLLQIVRGIAGGIVGAIRWLFWL